MNEKDWGIYYKCNTKLEIFGHYYKLNLIYQDVVKENFKLNSKLKELNNVNN